MLRWITDNKTIKKIAVLVIVFWTAIFLIVLFFSPGPARAQGADFGLESVGETLILGQQDIRLTIAKIIRGVLGFLGIIALVLGLYAGYTIMTSGGDEQKVATGKKILINAIIGLAIVLSAFAITEFLIRKLAEATGVPGAGLGGGPPGTESFTTSGALGTIVRDHYPFRNQKGVPRNTKISVTFFEAFSPASVFEDSNGNGVYGDCVNTETPTFAWESDCDKLAVGAIEVVELSDEGAPVGSALPMNALAVYEDGSVYTLVLRPLEFLGSGERDVWYSVDLTANILKESGDSMFATDPDGHYDWRFQTGTEIDISPPFVKSVWPAAGASIPRNTIIQINFSEAMDPTMVSGATNSFYHIIFGDSAVSGFWRVANNYQTVEFVSYLACGQNSCGDPMYCLPTACPTGDMACFDARQVLVRTADLVEAGDFEALPFSGVMDMAGNALDGDKDGFADGKPALGALSTIDAGEGSADNYLFGFQVQNIIDRSSPYVESIIPDIDAADVPSDAPFEILFSKPMWAYSLGEIGVEEYESDLPFWYAVWSELEGGKTRAIVKHRIFGPDDADVYYFTSVGAQVKSLTQNCVYPGRGPAVSGVDCVQDTDGNISGGTCVTTTNNPNDDTGCVYTGGGPELLGTVEECIETLKGVSPVF